MRVLWIATKTPWPPVDGGRLLLWSSLRALRGRDVEVTLVAPAASGVAPAALLDVCRPALVGNSGFPGRGGFDLVLAGLRRQPLTIRRHARSPVRRQVEELLASEHFDVVQVEQVQALAQVPDGVEGMPPVVLRAQNVESDLWRLLAELPGTPKLLAGWLGRQADLLARYEGDAVRQCSATVALTERDADGLRRLAAEAAGDSSGADDAFDSALVEIVPAPVESELPPGPMLDGDPAVVVFGGSGWKPNAEGARWFLDAAWPEVMRRNPGAVLHLFGGKQLVEKEDDRVRAPAPPGDSAEAFARGSVLVVPLRVASGVRMKILEAWARGVAVVATPAAARGLRSVSGEELLVAETPADLAQAVSEATSRYDALTSAARRRLRADYAFDTFADRLLALYRRLGIA